MRNLKYTFPLASLLFVGGWSLIATSCSDEWDDHYDAAELTSTQSVEVFKGSAWSYLQAQSQLSTITSALSSRSDLLSGDACTVIVCTDDQLAAQSAVQVTDSNFIANSISDIAVAPTSLTDGRGIYMQSGKNLWVTVDAQTNAISLNEIPVTRTIKVDNGYIYYVASPIAVQPSVYTYLQSLGDDYSLFKEYIALFEEQYFDAAASTPAGVDEMGNTYYSDSVIETRNTLMDRYSSEGIATWNMRSESFQSTMFIPNNALLKHAYESALDSIPYWMNRAATAADSLKFKKWIVASCFVDRRLTPAEVAPTAEGQFECVGGCIQEIDETLDKETYTEYDAAQWKPSVQKANTDGVDLSNGVAYFLTDYKIPNHIVIWRVKAKFYQVWSALTATQQGWDATAKQPTDGGYFRWNHWSEPLVVNDAQGNFELSSTLPTMYYHVLTAIPDAEALSDSLPCSVEYDGLMYNADDKKFGLSEVHLPAGEYYLRMGFKHSLRYSISIYFADGDEEITEDHCLVKDMSLIATGSNFHFDRGGAMEGLDFYGSESVGYPEYFDWRFWYEQDPVTYQKASAYDTDGYQVAIVTLKKPGNFKIKIESNDDAELFSTGTGDRSKNNVLQLMMYHWCLRPTTNNY
jgi:hypothetical protein